MDSFDLKILLLSGLPLTELRITIPMAIAMGMAPWRAFFLAIIGNMIPIIPILILLEPVSNLVRRITFFDNLFNWLIKRTRTKSQQVQKYGALGLILFVGIPLPGTGAWTGAMLAWLFGINFWFAITSIFLGVILAGLILTIGSLGFLQIVYIFYEIEYLILIFLLIAVIYLWKITKKYKKS